MNGFFTRNGRPFFVLGGQAHNSTTGNPNDREVFWRALDALSANTAEMPVYWEAIEPEEGWFDFSSVDALFEEARAHEKALILLWFGTWKNGGMRYVPGWVKKDTRRFPRVVSHEGNRLFALSSHSRANRDADAAAFSHLMAHLNALNHDGTLVAVQVENEAGIAGRSYRDFGPEGERDYLSPVPEMLLDALEAAPGCPLERQWKAMGAPRGENWGETFGVKNGAENLTAWSVASYINEVAKAGRAACDIPLYANAALDNNPWGWNLAGTNYTAGGPIPRLYELWKCAAPELDLLAPDIYLEGTRIFTEVCARYNGERNPLFVPESSSGPGGNFKNLFYTLGDYGAIGYAAFGVESLLDEGSQVKRECQPLVDSFRAVSGALPLLVKHRGSGRVRSVVQEPYEGGWFFQAEKYAVKIEYGEGYSNFLRQASPHEAESARGLVIEDGPDEFYALGSGFTVYFAPRDDVFYSEDRVTNHMPYLLVEEGRFDGAGRWIRSRVRTGDECDHGVWVFPENEVVHVILCE